MRASFGEVMRKGPVSSHNAGWRLAVAPAPLDRRAMLSREAFLEVVRNAPLVSIDVVVRDARGSVLVGLRNNRPARGWWFVPGGVIRKNERLEQAFRRISQAELGGAQELAATRFLGPFEHLYEDNFAG